MFSLDIILDIAKLYNYNTFYCINIPKIYKYIYTTKLNTIPEDLYLYKNLRILHCRHRFLKEINIPYTLTHLRKINICCNVATKLIISDTLINLQEIRCTNNEIISLYIPKSLINLQKIVYSSNNKTEIHIPVALINLRLKTVDVGRFCQIICYT
jgi:hypothetical protein